MLVVEIPGGEPLRLATLLLDYNGTLALDGVLLPGVAERLERLAAVLRVVVLTADTHGTVHEQVRGLPVAVEVIGMGGTGQDVAKRDALRACGAASCAAMGNGRNDALMLGEAAFSVAVLGGEGVAGGALQAAQVVVRDIRDGLDLLLVPGRLKATLRC